MITPAQQALQIERAAELIDAADALVIAAGAGMGVDSGLPDFRGPEGFWRAYPALGRARMHFEDIAAPETFYTRPTLAWGFYGHRLQLYRRTEPHEGFRILRRWADNMPHGAFVFTSNVDGQFQKAGFPGSRVCEVHGSIHDLQCIEPCSDDIWRADGFEPRIDEHRCLLLNEPPQCPRCGKLARPNILMFGDMRWNPRRSKGQRAALDAWLERVERPVLIECGAGTNIPSVRHFSQWLVLDRSARLIRINPREPESNAPSVSLATGALEALSAIDEVLHR